MNFIKEELSTPIAAKYDVIVVGAGPAGIAAALSCARGGLNTLIFDRVNCLGGGWTAGLINPLFDHQNKSGILSELISDLDASGQWGGFFNMSFNYEYMKHLLDTKMQQAGVDVLLNTFFAKTITENNRVTGVITENIDGRKDYLAKIVFDCTGDGSVCADAGCEFQLGSEENGYKDCQPMTLMFLVGNVPEKYKEGAMLGDVLKRAYEKAGKDLPYFRPFLIPIPNSKFAVLQFTHMYEYNPLSAKDISAATVAGRQQIIDAFDALKRFDPDFSELELITSANVLGVRESRRIVGEYTLTLEDLVEGRQFEDAVANVTYGIDVHAKHGSSRNYQMIRPYQIPMRCLIPKGFYGLIVAGRCISGSMDSMASYRVTGNCCQMGETAGKVAVAAIKAGIDVRDVDVKPLFNCN